MEITASIVLYKTPPSELQHICECLLKSSLISKLFLVDNSPDDRLKNVIVMKKVKLVFVGENISYGAGHNIAIKKIIDVSSFHLVLNSDISFKPDIIDKLLSYIVSNPDIGHMMPKIIYPNGQIQYSCKLLPTPIDMLIRRFFLSALFKKRDRRFHLKFTTYEEIMEVPYLSGCFMFLRTEALKKVGLFDERFFMYPEDIDLTRRIHKEYKTIYFPEVLVIHNHIRESRKNIRLFFILIINMIRYFNKWGWFFDAERRKINKRILEKLNYKREL